MPKVYIIILNYKGWQDTIECLESVFRLNYPNFGVIVVDNGSGNQSLENIQKWADGQLAAKKSEVPSMQSFSFPALPKPIPYLKCNANDIDQLNHSQNHQPLILIQSDENVGFAAGNNIGIRYTLAKNDFEYLWILNNDTVVDTQALHFLVSKAESNKDKGKKTGIIGAKVLYYYRSDTIQCVGGGNYYKWLAYSVQLGNQQKDNGQFDIDEVNLDLIIGACMLVSKPFLLDIGLMGEDYFLYYEEQDWAIRGKRKGWSLDYAWQAKIYHKEGASIGGTQLDKKNISKLSDFYYARNKIIFTKKFHGPLCLTTVYGSFILIILNRIRRKQFNRIPMLFDIMLHPSHEFVKKPSKHIS